MYGELLVTIQADNGRNAEILRDGTVFTKGKVYPVIHQMELQSELQFLLITNANKFMWMSVNRVDPYSHTPLHEMIFRNNTKIEQEILRLHDKLYKFACDNNLSLHPDPIKEPESTQTIVLHPEDQVPAEEGSLEELQAIIGEASTGNIPANVISGTISPNGTKAKSK